MKPALVKPDDQIAPQSIQLARQAQTALASGNLDTAADSLETALAIFAAPGGFSRSWPGQGAALQRTPLRLPGSPDEAVPESFALSARAWVPWAGMRTENGTGVFALPKGVVCMGDFGHPLLAYFSQ